MIALHMLTVLLADYLSYIQVCSMIFGPLKLLIFMWYLKTIRHEAKMLSKILIAPTLAASDVHSSSQQGGEEQHKSTNYIRKRIVCQVPDPVPVQQLLHFNAFQTIWMNVNKKDQRSVQMHRSLFEPNHYRPVITFFGKTPIVTFASVDACKTILTKWREFPKDPIMLSDDVHRFVGRNVVFVNGDEWKRQRSVMNPAFNDIERFTHVFVENCEKAVQLLSEQLNSSETNKNKQLDHVIVSPSIVTTRLALDVLGMTVFNVKFNYLSELLCEDQSTSSMIQSDRPTTNKMLDAYHYIMNHILNPGRLFLGKMYTSLPLESNRKMDQALDTFNEQLMHLIQQCKEEKSGHTTFEEKEQSLLQMMVDSVDEEGSGLTNSELKDNCAVFFLAGHETTASALSSLFYSLAKNPHVQDKLYEEICSTFSNDATSVINYQKLHDMPYLECVLKENLRLYPPIALLPGRMLQSSQVIDGYKIPKGFVVSLNIFSLHRNPQVWGEDAEEFRPERFMENIYPPFALAPFGGGPRLCIGKQFSLTEQKAFAVTLLKRFKIELLHPGQVMHFNKNTPSLAPVEDFKLKLVRRFDY